MLIHCLVIKNQSRSTGYVGVRPKWEMIDRLLTNPDIKVVHRTRTLIYIDVPDDVELIKRIERLLQKTNVAYYKRRSPKD